MSCVVQTWSRYPLEPGEIETFVVHRLVGEPDAWFHPFGRKTRVRVAEERRDLGEILGFRVSGVALSV